MAALHSCWGAARARALMGALLLAALLLRVLVNTDAAHVYRWLGLAASAFLCATLTWGVFLLVSLRRSPG